MTFGQAQPLPLSTRFGAGVGISIVLHVLVVSLAFMGMRQHKAPEPSYYRIRLVDLPAPPLREPMPEAPTAIELAKPGVPLAEPSAPAVSDIAPDSVPDIAPDAPDAPDTHIPALGPHALYDREEIESTATSSARAEAAKDDGVTFDTKDMMYRSYLDMLRQKVESIWVYPRRAAEEGIYGDVLIRFIILKDGSLGEVKVLRTSGHSMLDKAAVKALRDGIPYWALPDGWERQSLPITGRFVYSIRGGYIR